MSRQPKNIVLGGEILALNPHVYSEYKKGGKKSAEVAKTGGRDSQKEIPG